MMSIELNSNALTFTKLIEMLMEIYIFYIYFKNYKTEQNKTCITILKGLSNVV